MRRAKQTHEANRSQGRVPGNQLGSTLALVAEVRCRSPFPLHSLTLPSALRRRNVER